MGGLTTADRCRSTTTDSHGAEWANRRYRRWVAIITGGVLGDQGASGRALKAVMRRITAFAPRVSDDDYAIDLGFFSWSAGVGPRPPGSPDGPGVRPWMVGTTWLGSAGSTSQRSPDSTQPRRSLRRSKRSPGISRPPKRCDRRCRSTTDSHEGERTNPRCLFPAELYARAACVAVTFDLTPHPKPKSHAGAGSDDCHREAGDCIDSRRDDYSHNHQQCGEVEENELR